jgi:serine O-acetyltransferase
MGSLVETLVSDYKRHGGSLRNMAFWAIANYRFGRWADQLPPGLRAVGGKVYGAVSFFIEATSGIILYRETQVGKDFHLVHAGNIKIHPQTVIGDRVGIMHDVTLGTTPDGCGVPTIGDDVFIGAGARILGSVKIGDRARIAANSLVISDVPPDTTAIGVPAKILRYTGRPVGDSSAPAQALPAPSR